MTAADYFAWWRSLGTQLGCTSQGEHFQRLHRELSPAGANVVIVAHFLEAIPGVIDHERLMQRRMIMLFDSLQLNLTIEALQAIGAIQTAALLRDWVSVPPSFQQDARRAMLNPSFKKTVDALRAEMLAAAADKQVETREEVARLLEAYVAHSQDALDSDMAKKSFIEEQTLRSIHQRELQEFRQTLAAMEQRMDKAQTVSPALQKQAQKLLNEYRDYLRRDPENMTAELQGLLREVERLRDERPDVFRPKPTADDALNTRLAAIGDYELDLDTQFPTITWRSPPGLECEWTQFDLTFMVSFREARPTVRGTNAQRLATAYEALIEAWEHFRVKFREWDPQLKQYVLDDFSRAKVARRFDDEELAEYQDDSGEISDAAILRHVHSGDVLFDSEGLEVHGPRISFDVDWDLEHGVAVELDADGEIIRSD